MRSDEFRVSKSRASSPDGRGVTPPISQPFPINPQTSASPNAGQPLAMQKRVRQTIIHSSIAFNSYFFETQGSRLNYQARSLGCQSVVIVASTSRIMTPSVISSFRLVGDNPACLKVCSTCSTKAGCWNWRGDKLTLIVSSGSVGNCSCHLAVWRHASSNRGFQM